MQLGCSCTATACSTSGRREPPAPLTRPAWGRGWSSRQPLSGTSRSSPSSKQQGACRAAEPAEAAPAPPPARFASGASQTQHLYSCTDEPITSFGFARNFDQKYDMGAQLGAGTFGLVFSAVDRTSGERFAVKSMRKRFGPSGHLDQYYARRVLNEVDIGMHLGRSLNICYLHEVFEDAQNVHLLMQLCSGGQLWDRVKAGAYSEQDARRLVREIVRTVAQCHGQDVMLRDIKPENFMFLNTEEDSPLKAIDFGISVFCKPGQYVDVRAGTPIYIAPEVLRMRYTLSADLWSVGIVAYQLLTGRLPFSGEEGLTVSEMYMSKQTYSNRDVFRAVLYSELDFESRPWDAISAEARSFVQALLQRDEQLRPTAEEALQHVWLQDDHLVSDAPFSDTIVQRLQRFGLYGHFRQVALRQVAHAIAADSELVGELRRQFEALDTDGDMKISHESLRTALQDGHFSLSASEAEQLMSQIDVDRNGMIGFDDWVAAMADWRQIQDSSEWDRLVSEVFKSMDVNGQGSLGPGELELLLCGEEGCEVPDTVEAALREADADHDGSLSLDEFKSFLGNSRRDDRLDLFESRLAVSSDAAAIVATLAAAEAAAAATRPAEEQQEQPKESK